MTTKISQAPALQQPFPSLLVKSPSVCNIPSLQPSPSKPKTPYYLTDISPSFSNSNMQQSAHQHHIYVSCKESTTIDSSVTIAMAILTGCCVFPVSPASTNKVSVHFPEESWMELFGCCGDARTCPPRIGVKRGDMTTDTPDIAIWTGGYLGDDQIDFH